MIIGLMVGSVLMSVYWFAVGLYQWYGEGAKESAEHAFTRAQIFMATIYILWAAKEILKAVAK